jgi:hypothetical protein
MRHSSSIERSAFVSKTKPHRKNEKKINDVEEIQKFTVEKNAGYTFTAPSNCATTSRNQKQSNCFREKESDLVEPKC